MGAVTNLIRRGVIYYWRRRMRWPDGAICAIWISLRTAQFDVARSRAEHLALFAARALTEGTAMAAHQGLSAKSRQDLFNRSVAAEIARLAVYHDHGPLFEAGPEGGLNESFPRILNNQAVLTGVLAERGAPLEGGIDALSMFEGLYLLPCLSERAQYDFCDQHPSYEDILDWWTRGVEEALAEYSIASTPASRQTALRAIYAGKNWGLRQYQAALRQRLVDRLTSGDLTISQFDPMDWAEWPYLLFYETRLANSVVAEDKIAQSSQQVQPGPASPAKGEVRSGIAGRRLVEAGEAYISEKLQASAGAGSPSSGKRRRMSVDDKTADQVRAAVKLLGKIWPGPVSGLVQGHLDELDAIFDRLPTSHHKSKRHDFLSLQEIIAEGEEAVAQGRIGEKDIGLETPTTNRHFNFLKGFLHWSGRTDLEFDQYITVDRRNRRNLREAYSVEEEVALFSLPAWTGCQSASQRFVPGEEIFHDAIYWVFIMAAYSGARCSEICELLIANVNMDSSIPYFSVASEGGKTENSLRKVPINKELIRLGFSDYVSFFRQSGHIYLFPELQGFSSFPGDIFGDRCYSKIGKILGLPKGKRLHSFRHTVDTELKAKGVSAEIRADLFGHAQAGETKGRYAKSAPLHQLHDAVELIPNVTAHIEARPIQLLPQVERVSPQNGVIAKKKITNNAPVTSRVRPAEKKCVRHMLR